MWGRLGETSLAVLEIQAFSVRYVNIRENVCGLFSELHPSVIRSVHHQPVPKIEKPTEGGKQVDETTQFADR